MPLMARFLPPQQVLPQASVPPIQLPTPHPRADADKRQTSSPQGRPTKKTGRKPGDWMQQVRDQFRQRNAAGLFYPAEAIAQGQQGEVLVLMVLDADGKVGAARIESSSGYPVLDNAALGAVRALRSLPAETPREVILPVRFRLE